MQSAGLVTCSVLYHRQSAAPIYIEYKLHHPNILIGKYGSLLINTFALLKETRLERVHNIIHKIPINVLFSLLILHEA
jgi:hypothetical protein